MSTSLAGVTGIEAIAFQYGDPQDGKAIRMLEGVATLPYEGSQPDRVLAWLKESMATRGDIRIAGVDFHLYGSGSVRTLEIIASGGR